MQRFEFGIFLKMGLMVHSPNLRYISKVADIFYQLQLLNITAELKGSVKEPNFSIHFLFLPITQWCSISDVLFTGGREVSDFSVLKYY